MNKKPTRQTNGRLLSSAVGIGHYSSNRLIIWICLAITLLCPGIVVADSDFSYNVRIEGVADRKLRKVLEAISDTVELRKRPPASLSLLRRRVNRDLPRFLKALKAYSFHGANVTAEIDTKSEPIQVTFLIDTGPPYLLKCVDIEVSGEGSEQVHKLPEARDLGLILGDPAKSKSILDAEKLIIRYLKKDGFPFPQIAERKVVVDHAARAVLVTFRVIPGPLAQFGSIEITGLKSVDEAFVRKKIPWKEGDRFNADLLTEAQRRMNATGIFATVHLKTGEALDEKGQLPVTIAVKERKHRTVKAGVSYRTDEGPGGKISWEHRNLFGRGEYLNIALTGSGIVYAAEGAFRKPEFLRRDQSLLLNLRVADEHPDAYTSRSVTSELLVERMLSKGISLNAGLAYRVSQIDQLDQEDSFGLLSVPIRFKWDTSDHLFDPTRGGRLTLQVIPYYDTFSGDLGFVKGYASFSRYVAISKKPSLVLAGRAALGAMAGAERDAIPADIRFYAGGGGSIRGYPFQSVGPLRGDEPIGGRSLIELSAELRIKITRAIGIVAFIDGGSAFEAVVPNFKEDLRWGAGVGLRYHTPIGPLRLDVGFPLNQRKDIDDPLQVYFSLGQAF